MYNDIHLDRAKSQCLWGIGTHCLRPLLLRHRGAGGGGGGTGRRVERIYI